jgi:hypothetical protein
MENNLTDYYFEIWASGMPGYWFYSDFKIIRAENGFFAEEMARKHCDSLKSNIPSFNYQARSLRTL